MAQAGRPLDPWQVDAVTLMLAVRDDAKWACFEYCEWVCRQQGKGAILEARALTGFLLLGEELIMWSAHEYKTAMEAFRRVKGTSSGRWARRSTRRGTCSTLTASSSRSTTRTVKRRSSGSTPARASSSSPAARGPAGASPAM
ncbi:hypothetical protein V2I01_04925 [Micromonospora sp. BRA006-A]|nr:hypothetical protein [Micromonospora sp. BRA006-A]